MSRLKVPVTSKDHIQGNPQAPHTLVEYGDYECPFCGAAHPVVKQLQAYYGEELRFVYRHFPLTQIHPLAEPAAETAEFAAEYHLFWEMDDLLYENQGQLGWPLFMQLAEFLQLPPDELERSLENRIFQPRVREQFLSGVYSGVNGTPTFFIDEERHQGPFDFHTLMAAIEHSKLKK